MRIKFILSGFIACALMSAHANAQENTSAVSQGLQNMVDSGTQAAKDAGNNITNAIPSLPPLPGEEKPKDAATIAAEKAAASSLSAPTPAQLALPPVPTAAPATSAMPASNNVAPGNVLVPATLAAPPTAVAPSALPLPIMDTKDKTLNPASATATPAAPIDPGMLPSPGNQAASPPAILPFTLPGTVTPTTPTVVVTPPPPAIVPQPAVVQQPPAQVTPEKAVKRVAKKRKPAATKVRYRNIHMPETIYKKQYDKLNKYLPTATYESDLDALLFVAIKQDNINGVRAMLDYSKRNINKPNAKGETPLMVAVKSNAINTTRLLLGRHADSRAQDAQGATALQIARQKGNSKIVNLLQNMGGEAQLAKWEPERTENYNPRSPLQLIKPQQPDFN